MFAFDPARAELRDLPFPHAVVDGVFAPHTLAELSATYPLCPPGSGPTGHTIHRGDALFDQVMVENPGWRALYERCNAPHFLDELSTLFVDEIDRACLIPRQAMRFVDHVETRREKETNRIADPALPPECLFLRFDFMQGMESYAREPHLDHRRRLATMLVYFESPGPDTFDGGELVLHDANGGVAATVPPTVNRAVLLACSERSWHSVNAVRRCTRPRRFLQISITSCHDIWPGARLPAAGPVDWGKRMLRSLLRAA